MYGKGAAVREMRELYSGEHASLVTNVIDGCVQARIVPVCDGCTVYGVMHAAGFNWNGRLEKTIRFVMFLYCCF